MSSKSKIFVCDQHASNILQNLQTFYQNQKFSDIGLATKTDNSILRAHRAVLSASSPYLAFLCCTLTERSDVIKLEIDGATLKAVVDFMYSGTIELRWENVARILAASDVLNISTLKVACSDFIGETIDSTNWLSVVTIAEQQKSTELKKNAFEFALQNFEEVSKKVEFLHLTEEQLRKLISSDDLCVSSEETVFHSVVSWWKHDKGRREESIIHLLSHVRFSFLTPEFIIDSRKSLCRTYECLELLFSWLESHLSRTKLTKRHSKRKKVNGAESETLGYVNGDWTNNLKLQSLDPISNIWTCEDLTPSPSPKRAFYKAMIMNKKLIVAGGSLNCGTITNIVQCLDLQTKEWTNLPPMRQARSLPGMAELNGELYVSGGYGQSSDECLRSVEKYNFYTREWKEMAPTHYAHDSIKVTVLGEQLYVVGNSSFPIECFNPTDNKWTQLPHKNERSTRYGIAGVGGYLYAVGGLINLQGSKIVERFHPSTNTWTVISPGLDLELHGLKCASWNNRLVAVIGSQYSGVQYLPEKNEWTKLSPLVYDGINYLSSSLFTFVK